MTRTRKKWIAIGFALSLVAGYFINRAEIDAERRNLSRSWAFVEASSGRSELAASLRNYLGEKNQSQFHRQEARLALERLDRLQATAEDYMEIARRLIFQKRLPFCGDESATRIGCGELPDGSGVVIRRRLGGGTEGPVELDAPRTTLQTLPKDLELILKPSYVVFVMETVEITGKYSTGGKAIQARWDAFVIDWGARTVVAGVTLFGDDAPFVIKGPIAASAVGELPTKKLDDWIRTLESKRSKRSK